jgi:hypothetical protein
VVVHNACCFSPANWTDLENVHHCDHQRRMEVNRVRCQLVMIELRLDLYFDEDFRTYPTNATEESAHRRMEGRAVQGRDSVELDRVRISLLECRYSIFDCDQRDSDAVTESVVFVAVAFSARAGG